MATSRLYSGKESEPATELVTDRTQWEEIQIPKNIFFLTSKTRSGKKCLEKSGFKSQFCLAVFSITKEKKDRTQ